jgi:hypothetical protein
MAAAMLLITAAAATGCAAAAPPVPAAPSTVITGATGTASTSAPADAAQPSRSTTAAIAVDGQRGRPAAGATSPSLPADWPPDLPAPNGTLTGATGSNGQWTAQYLMLGSAADVRQSTVDLYRAAGFTAVSDSVLTKGNCQLTLAVENRDHSASETTLLIQLSIR